MNLDTVNVLRHDLSIATGESWRAHGIVVEHEPCRMGERDAERAAGSQYSIDLTEHSVKIVDACKRVHRECEVDLIGANKGQIGEVTVMKFDFDLVNFGELASSIDSSNVVIDCDHMSTGERQAHGVMTKANAKLEDLLALWRRNQAQRVVAGKVWTPCHRVERKFCSTRK